MTAVASSVSSQVLEILRQQSLSPRGVQKEAIEKGLLSGESIMIVSPTGSGKTLVGEMAALRAVLSGKKAMYLVPLRALATQVGEIIRDRYSEVGISVGTSTGDFQTDAEYLGESDIVVTTYERADSLLRRHVGWLTEIGTVVIDEIQTISEGIRGARLESLMIRLRRMLPELQVVALSATVGAPADLAEWLGCTLIHSDTRPVPLHCAVVPTSDRLRTLRNIVMTTVRADGQVIVFCRTRRDAESYAARLAGDVGRQLTSHETVELDSELDSVENWEANVPRELRRLLHDGIAFHHAGLAYRTRELVERLFRRGLLRVMCSTSTLSAGIDFPARTVVVTNPRSPQDYTQFLHANRVHQMLGRAGRPGHDRAGFGVILAGSQGEADMLRNSYFESVKDPETGAEILIPRYEPLRSNLGDPRVLPEQLLVAVAHLGQATLQEIEDGFFGDSFLTFCAIRDTRTPMRVLNLGEIDAASAIERHALPETVRSAREGVLGQVTIREKSDTTIGGIVRDWEGAQYTCRFSSRVKDDGLVEGPMCSCGSPQDDSGILCPHLVALGTAAGRELGSLADYVVPLALSEVSPFRILVRLGLVEGAFDGKIRPTRLGRVVNRLYLQIPVLREMQATLPTISDNPGLLWLLRHLISMESGTELSDSFDSFIAGLVSTELPFETLASAAELNVGDALALVETAEWMLAAMAAVAEVGGLPRVVELAGGLLRAIELRIGPASTTGG
ncbi:MAG: DEAD/DEAH box helicase [Candidatus Thorarchaeota archaeon]